MSPLSLMLVTLSLSTGLLKQLRTILVQTTVIVALTSTLQMLNVAVVGGKWHS